MGSWLNDATDDYLVVDTGGHKRWLASNAPHVCTHPFSVRHDRLWNWFEDLQPDIRPRPRIEIWGRGGAKSSTAELGTSYVGAKGTRKFALYVSGTQDQADLHVQAIADILEHAGIERAINKYGTARGWRREQLQAANGFNVAAFGLDTGARGVKIRNFRPDLIILDDVDSQHDSPATVQKKIEAITYAIIPAGSPDCAILGIQNLIHEEGVFSQLVDGRAEFLLDREVPEIIPAVEGLEIERVLLDDGAYVYRIVGGKATWEGQSLETCERQINDWGLRAFLREAQHEVAGADGTFFDHTKFEVIDLEDVPWADIVALCRAWDLAGTKDGGDFTVGVLFALHKNRRTIYVIDVKRGQWNTNEVRTKVLQTAFDDRYRYGNVTIHIPQDPGQAGKDQVQQYIELLHGFDVHTGVVTGKKATRASGWSDCVNGGNAKLVRAPWNHEYKEEHRKFREDETHLLDDQVDSSSDSYRVLIPLPASKPLRSRTGGFN